jgi:hypothetical protein
LCTGLRAGVVYSRMFPSPTKPQTSDYSIFEFDVQEPLAYGRGTATATVRERLNTQAENALNKSPHTVHAIANRQVARTL